MDKPALLRHYQIYLFVFFVSTLNYVHGLGKIVFAVNAGGDSHIDIYGIKYQKGVNFDWQKMYANLYNYSNYVLAH